MTKIDPAKKWTHPVPVWVSRKDNDGTVASFTVPLWMFLALGVIALLNVAAWGTIGLAEAVQYVL